MNCPHFVRFTVVLPAVAIMLAGCANSSSSVANSNASANTASAAPAAQTPAKQPQRFGAYGVSTTGYSSNLSTMINNAVTGEDDEPETKVATATPAGSAPATGAAPAAGAKTAAGAPPAGAPAPGQPQVAQNQPPQEPQKSKAQIAEESVPGLYGTPRAPQKDMVHWLMETTKDE